MPRIKQSVHFSESSNLQLLNKRKEFFDLRTAILATSFTPDQVVATQASLKSTYETLLKNMKSTKDEILKFYKESKSALDSEYGSIKSQMEGVSQLNERRKEYKDEYGLRNICNSVFHTVMDLDELWLSVVEYLDMKTVKSLRLTCFQWNMLVEQMAPISFKVTIDTLFFFSKFKRFRQLTLPIKASSKCISKFVDVLRKEDVMKVKIEDMSVNSDVLSAALSTSKIEALDISVSDALQLPIKLPTTVTALTIRKHQSNRWYRTDGHYSTRLVQSLINYVDEDKLQLRALHLDDSALSSVVHITNLQVGGIEEKETKVEDFFAKLHGLTSVSFPHRCLKSNALESFFLRNLELTDIYLTEMESISVFMSHLDDLKHLKHVSIPCSCNSQRITTLLQRGINISFINFSYQSGSEFWLVSQKRDTIKSKSVTLFSEYFLKPVSAPFLAELVTGGSHVETLGVGTSWKAFSGLISLLTLMKEGNTRVKHFIVHISYTRYTFSVKSSFCIFDAVTTIIEKLPETITTLTIDLERSDTKQTAHIRMTKTDEQQFDYVKKWLNIRPQLESICLCTRVPDFDSVNQNIKSTMFALQHPEHFGVVQKKEDEEEEMKDEEAPIEDEASLMGDDCDFIVVDEKQKKGKKRARSPTSSRVKGKLAKKAKTTKRKTDPAMATTTKRTTRSTSRKNAVV
mmetsp:Transcript_3194/g.12221  ORF Transcript_3194/g.12221 Transcript_3194/m.12221 type:complete len:686 (-) Transcript_3194:120-2177(-)